MPKGLKLFCSDVADGPGGVRLDARAVIVVASVPFWWFGERFPLPDQDHHELFISRNSYNHDDYREDGYGLVQARALYAEFPALSLVDKFSLNRISGEDLHRYAAAFAQVVRDDQAPAVEQLRFVSQVLDLAVSIDGFVEMSGR